MTLKERRGSPRVKLDHLVNLNLHFGNGGIVLDVQPRFVDSTITGHFK